MRRHSFWIGLFLLGCGRPATVEDCEHIVERITQLELKRANVVDPGEIKDQIQQTKTMFHDQTMSQCVGRHITDRARNCIEKAASAEQIENCFD